MILIFERIDIMKSIYDLSTPAFLVDLDIMENNLKSMQELCTRNSIRLFPMVKTHKSMDIAKMQKDFGAAGFLAGTVDEAEKLISSNFTDVMLAYPIADKKNISRIIALRQKANLILSFDGKEAAVMLQESVKNTDICFDYTIIIDSGLHRFGVKPEKAWMLAKELKELKNLNFIGISTHPGQVYGNSNIEEVKRTAEEEVSCLKIAKDSIEKEGFKVEITASGSTPTAIFAAKSGIINILRPGNYVFYDNIQKALGVAREDNCSFTILGTIISHPEKNIYIVDVGSKCLGLDKGAHGISLVNGYGFIKNHPELVITDLSEEVGKIRATEATDLKIGDKIRIIPNHACSSANMTSYLIGIRNNQVIKTINIDARGGSVNKADI